MSNYQLSTTDRRTVEIVASDTTDVARARKIHEEALAEAYPKLEAMQRVVAMREYSLELLADR